MKDQIRHPMNRAVCWYLSLFLAGFFLLPTTLQAALIPVPVPALEGDRLAEAQAAIEQGLLADRLERMGISPDEAVSRIHSLTAQERQAVLADLDRLQAGGDGVGALVGLAVLILLIVLIIKLMDKEIVIR